MKQIMDRRKNQISMEIINIIEGAYLNGFEPSSENLTNEQIFEEAQEYLFKLS